MMTLLQITLAVEIAERGSISAAANQLRISQPNASQALKKLEDELGFDIFRRVGGGVSPTEKGYTFLEHAKAIYQENQAIRSIIGNEYIPRLRVGVTNYTPAIEAFFRFCEENKDAPNADLLCLNLSSDESSRFLREGAIDISVTILLKETYPIAMHLCRENDFVMTTYGKFPLCVKLRAGHPLVKAGVLDGSMKGFQQLEKYPYVEYKQIEEVMNTYRGTKITHFGCSYSISVDDVDARMHLLSVTDAYSVGCLSNEKTMKKYKLISIPIENDECILASFVRKGDENLPGITRYAELLRDAAASK